MNVIPILLLCSLALGAAAVVLFVYCAGQGDCTQAERMCLMPLEDDDGPPADNDLSDNGSPDNEATERNEA